MEGFYYDEFYNEALFDTGVMWSVLGAVLVILAIVLVFALVSYVLQSVAMYTIAKRRGIKNPGLAWVPVANYWVLGCISDQYKYVTRGKVQNRRKVMLGLQIAAVVLSIVGTSVEAFVPNASSIFTLANYGVSIVSLVFWYMALYDLYCSCNPDNGVLYLVLSIIIGVTQPFFMLACRNKDKGMPPRKSAQPAYQPISEPQWERTPGETWQKPEAPASEPTWQPTETYEEPWNRTEE